MYNFIFIFLTFIIFSSIGWLVECTYCSIMNRKIVTNRGFLIGPYCPIYGLGALYFYIMSNYLNNPIIIFIVSFIGTSILEYVTSYMFEKIYKARWWDYSNEFLNINGRICLKNTILFGISALIFVYFIKPFYLDIIDKIDNNVLIIVSILLIVLFTLDCVISLNIMNKIKNNFINIKGDSTEIIENEVNKILAKYRFYAKKLFKSFPNVSFSIPINNDITNAVNKILHKENKNSR